MFRSWVLRLVVDAVLPYLIKNLGRYFDQEKPLWTAMVKQLGEVGHAEFVSSSWNAMPQFSFITDWLQESADKMQTPECGISPDGLHHYESLELPEWEQVLLHPATPEETDREIGTYRSAAGLHAVAVVCPKCSSGIHVSLDHVLTVDGKWDPPQ
jgi:hypothetical protein